MSEQESFEKWYKEKYYKYDLYPKYAQFRKEMKDVWQAAITEANKRIDALEGEVAELENSLQKIVEVLAAGADLNESYRKTIAESIRALKGAK